MNETPAEFEQFLNKFFDASWEPGFEEYKQHLVALNKVTVSAGVPIEGNLFAYHMSTELPDTPIEEFRAKRRNYALFVSGGKSLLEIGFNAGHSCLLALTVNKDLHYTGIDIGMHAYTKPCFDYLKSVFGDRMRLHIGDSREVLPALRGEADRFDLYHLDGGHGFSVAQADLCNLLNFGSRPVTMMVDDTGQHDIDAMCDYYVMQGKMRRLGFGRLWSQTIHHRMFRTIPS